MVNQVDKEQVAGGFWVGDWFIEPMLNRATRGEEAVQVEPKVMDVLVCLARRPGRTVTKKRFMEQVWAGTVVGEDVLSRCISELRKLLGDDSRDPRFIETIRKTGYRLIAPVRVPGAEAEGIFAAGGLASARAMRSRSPVALSTLWRQSMRHVAGRIRGHLARPLVRGLVVGLALLGASLLYWRAGTTDAVEPSVTVPLTSYPGQEVEPAVAPSGEKVAFAWDNNTGRDFDIYVKQIGAEPPLRITDELSDERSPAWSPDGLHLAFVRASADEHALFVVPAIGGTGRKVAAFGPRRVTSLAWSPDGQFLAVSAQQAPHQPYALFLVALDSADVRQRTVPPLYIQGDLRPAFSPDGKRLAFIRSIDEGVQDIYVASTAGGEPRQLTFDQAGIMGLDWTADGKEIVFASDRGGSSGLWRVAASGGEPAWVTTAGEGTIFRDLAVARQSDRLAYEQHAANVDIWELRRTQSSAPLRAHRLISSTRWDTNPQVSPDASRIAFASNRSGTHEIWTCDRVGRDLMQLTTFGGARASTPRWSPDGTHIAFVAREEGHADIYVVDAEGGEPRRLTTSPAEDTVPSWSHDGRSVYFASSRTGTWQIWKVDMEGGGSVQVTAEGGRAAAESLDGKVLYVVKPFIPGIWQIPTGAEPGADGQARLVVASLAYADWGNWSVGERGIYFVRRNGEKPELAFYNSTTDATTRLAPLKNLPEHPSFSAVPDGSWFLHTQRDRAESDILLVEHFR